MEDIQDGNSEQPLSPNSSNIGDIGYPHLPRVGDQYQANIPSITAECDHLQLKRMPKNSEVMTDINCSFIVGLPIPLMWSKAEVGNINETVESASSEESQITYKNEHGEFKIHPWDMSSGHGKDLGESNHRLEAARNRMEVDLILSYKPKTELVKVESDSCLLPGIASESWTDFERDSFLLGLYIFGKNLILVNRFVEGKGMGDILAFYYGQFYRSDEYHRWTEFRKLRSRRNIQGQKIFSGWRQQELLTRLLSRVSQGCHHVLLEVSRSYGEGKLAFEEYIFLLKHTVGLNVLVEAVGIGKGKQDLTSVAIEPVKHIVSVRPEIPIGKACSSLSPADIIKFLTGNFRLSKARSSDLFWEAVWPRLLARGWHSEQPKDQSISGSKYSLVFLVPGVKKFSRRRLVKGNHYFDSVSDVLNKVASDPGLIELEVEQAKGSEDKDGYRWNLPLKQIQDSFSNKQHHCYLQTKNLNCNCNAQRFTIIDTSLAYGTERPKVRELKSLPVGVASASCSSSSLSSEMEEDISEESQGETVEVNTQNHLENEIDRKTINDSSGGVKSFQSISPGDSLNPTSSGAENREIDSFCPANGEQPREAMKYQFSRKVNPDHPKYLIPLRKQESFVGCSTEQSISIHKDIYADIKLKVDESHYISTTHACENMIFRMCPAEKSSSASPLAEVSPDRSNEVIGENCQDRDVRTRKPQSPKLIDLNVPHVSLDFGDEPTVREMVQNNDKLPENKPSLLSEMNWQSGPLKYSDAGQPPALNNRRQSTRNRPLTTRALEALELGFLNTKKRKCGNSPENNKVTKSSQRVQGRTATIGKSDGGVQNDVAESEGGEVLDESYNNTDIVHESSVNEY